MSAYLLLFSWLVFMSFSGLYNSGRKIRLLIYSLSVLVLILFAGLRGHNVGFDYESYENIFEDSDDILQVSLLEPAFKLWVWFWKPFASFQLFLLATAVLAVSLKVFFIAKYSFYPLVSLVVYFVTILLINDMGQIRYGLAMSLMLLFFHEIVRSHIKKAFFFFFLAVLFHYFEIGRAHV